MTTPFDPIPIAPAPSPAPVSAAISFGAPVSPLTPRLRLAPLAVAGFILSLVPLCLNLIGAVLSIIALVQIKNRPNELRGHNLAIAGIVIGAGQFVLMPVIGILAAIAIPNFLMYQTRAKQSEAKTNLHAIYSAQKAYQAEHQTYAGSFKTLGWNPSGQTRYTYLLSADALAPTLGPKHTAEDIAPLLEEHLSAVDELDKALVAVAVGNIDTDPALDVWVVDSDGSVTNLRDDVHESDDESSGAAGGGEEEDEGGDEGGGDEGE
jgi:type IV pilus assembly protein PilA